MHQWIRGYGRPWWREGRRGGMCRGHWEGRGGLEWMKDVEENRAYFKESLQLHRTETFQTSEHFYISCPKKYHFLQISDDLFLVILNKHISISLLFLHFIHQNFWRPVKVISSISYVYVSALSFQTMEVQLHNQLFAHHSFTKFHDFNHSFQRFSAVPVQNLQLQLHNSHFYNCKLHFTTAQIVISCTLKYALGCNT